MFCKKSITFQQLTPFYSSVFNIYKWIDTYQPPDCREMWSETGRSLKLWTYRHEPLSWSALSDSKPCVVIHLTCSLCKTIKRVYHTLLNAILVLYTLLLAVNSIYPWKHNFDSDIYIIYFNIWLSVLWVLCCLIVPFIVQSKRHPLLIIVQARSSDLKSK